MKKGQVIARSGAIVVAPPPSQNVSIEAVIQNAIDKGVPVGTMERLLAMRRELKAEAAKEAYDRSMSLFQEKCPVIEKKKEVKNDFGKILYKYAPIDSIVSQVKGLVKKHGFSYTIDTKTDDAQLTAICKVTHDLGHSETSSFTVPADTGSKIMSAPQKAAAALTFAKRYAFCNAFGILTGDEDTDAPPQKEPMKPYNVARSKAAADDEAGGAVIKDENQELIDEADREEMKGLLLEMNYKIKSKNEFIAAIVKETNMPPKPENYKKILAILRKKSPMEEALKKE